MELIDYTPNPEQIEELEDLFGALLEVGHSVREAAQFIIDLSTGRIDQPGVGPAIDDEVEKAGELTAKLAARLYPGSA